MVTNEYFKRLAALIIVLSHIVAAGETARAGDWMPLLPSQDFYDFQLFAPPDMQDYEIYPEPSGSTLSTTGSTGASRHRV